MSFSIREEAIAHFGIREEALAHFGIGSREEALAHFFFFMVGQCKKKTRGVEHGAMADIVLLIAVVNGGVYGVNGFREHPQGIPLAMAAFAGLYAADALPKELQDTGPLRPPALAALLVLQDALQFGAHVVLHRAGSRSHAIHHTRVAPTVRDAFHAGFVDVVLQLLLPVFASLWAVRPNRATAAVFGAAYAVWLQWIHADDEWSLSWRSRWLVTPAFHREHHKSPSTNFGHLLTLWDRAFATCRA